MKNAGVFADLYLLHF